MKNTSKATPSTSAPKAARTKKKPSAANTIPAKQHSEIGVFGVEPNHADIALLAQQIYEEEGSPSDRAEVHWLEAERRLRQEAATAVSG